MAAGISSLAGCEAHARRHHDVVGTQVHRAQRLDARAPPSLRSRLAGALDRPSGPLADSPMSSARLSAARKIATTHQHDADSQRAQRVEARIAGQLGREQAQEGEDKADHRRDVLDEHGQHGRVLRFEQARHSPPLRRRPARGWRRTTTPPRARTRWPARRSWPARCRSGADRRSGSGPRRTRGRRRPRRAARRRRASRSRSPCRGRTGAERRAARASAAHADDQHDLVGGVDERVDALGEHRELPVRNAAMNLAAAMPRLASERADDRDRRLLLAFVGRVRPGSCAARSACAVLSLRTLIAPPRECIERRSRRPREGSAGHSMGGVTKGPARSLQRWRPRDRHHDHGPRAATARGRHARRAARAVAQAARLRPQLRLHRHLLEQPPPPAARGAARSAARSCGPTSTCSSGCRSCRVGTAWIGDTGFRSDPVAVYGFLRAHAGRRVSAPRVVARARAGPEPRTRRGARRRPQGQLSLARMPCRFRWRSSFPYVSVAIFVIVPRCGSFRIAALRRHGRGAKVGLHE